MKEIKTVSVVGANGVMGYSISAIFASFGGAKVYMVAKEAAEQAALNAMQTVKAGSISKRLVPKTFDDMAEVIPQSDLVFESVVENMEIKKTVGAQIAAFAREDAIIATGTSGLSIEELAACFPEKIRERYTGTHFFNPPYNLTLCEVIPTAKTDKTFLREYKEYLAKVLLRSVVEVRDEAGFLGNRIGFQLMNEALQFAEIHKDRGGVDYIDAVLGPFSGRSMPPLATADFVGLDVHKAIVDNIYAKTYDAAHETFLLPAYAQKLIDAGKLGVKTREGLYKTVKDEAGKSRRLVYDIASGEYRGVKNSAMPFADAMVRNLRTANYAEAFTALKKDASPEAKLCLGFLLKYVVYSLITAKAVAEKADDADTTMVTGFNWAPAIGVMEALGGAAEMKRLIKENCEKAWLHTVDYGELFAHDMKSAYDYRSFFKAKR